jgi:hypothetical protein
LEALELLKRGDKNASENEQQLGITPGLLTKWRARCQVIQSELAVRLWPSDLERAWRLRFGDKAALHRLTADFGGALDMPALDGVMMANSLYF